MSQDTNENQEAETLAASALEGASSSDALDSSSESQQQSATSSDDNAGKSMADIIKAAFDKSAAATSAEDEAPEPPAKPDPKKEQEKSDTEKEKDGGDKEEVAATDKESAEKPKQGPVPYERFAQVVHKRQEIESELTRVKPVVEQHQKIVDYCTAHNISQQQFTNALEIAALLNSDPAKALEKLSPVIESLQGFVGAKLPDDLQKDVDGGELSLGRAKEIAQLRAQKQFGQKHSEHQQRLMQSRQEEVFKASLVSATQAWENSKRTTDPDYSPKASEDAPDGKWELTRDRFLAMLHAQDAQGQFQNPVRTPQEMTALMERAYREISRTYDSFRPKSASKKVLTRNGSSQPASRSYEEAKSMSEAIRMAAATHGI